MGNPARATHLDREPDNELYDRGSDLVEAAAAIRRAASAPGATRAIPAVLGCFESALEELLWAAAALEEGTRRSVSAVPGRPADTRTAMRWERMNVGYANLQRALSDAERAAAAARPLAQRALTTARYGVPG